MIRAAVIGALGVVLALAGGCGGGHASPVSDADGVDAGADLARGDDAETDGSNTGDGSTPAPCGAGLLLDGVCSGYCSNLTTACTDSNSQFPSGADCLTACTAPTWSCGAPADTTGNTIFCRIAHAMAATLSPDIECPQAGPNSASCI